MAQIILSIVALGFVLRIAWLGVGLWRLRKYRQEATLLAPKPDAFVRAEHLTGVSAEVRISATAVGPVTFGFRRPVVLIPQSVLEMNTDKQCGIVVHELLHVRRRDWLFTLLEEFYGALFWFHPVVWWVLARTRLAREEIVDREVIRMTDSLESYIHALIQFAGVGQSPHIDLAPLFLRKRHLAARMRSLLSEVHMTKLRLVTSYGFVALVLAGAGSLALTAFPLLAQAQESDSTASSTNFFEGESGNVFVAQIPGIPLSDTHAVYIASTQPPVMVVEDEPGFTIERTAMFYPPEAIVKGIEGSVVLELKFNSTGEIVDSRLISGPDELRRAALQTALQGNYAIDSARSLQVVVNFELPDLANAVLTEGGDFTLPLGILNPERLVNSLEQIEIHGISGDKLSGLQQELLRFEGQSVSPDLMKQIQLTTEESGAGRVAGLWIATRDDGTATLNLLLHAETN